MMATVHGGRSLDRSEVLEQLVCRRGDVRGRRALGPAHQDVGGVELDAQVLGLCLEHLAGESSQHRSRGSGGFPGSAAHPRGHANPRHRHSSAL
jgi:hypothetical protein